MAEAYIVAAVRTAGGKRGSALAGWHPADTRRSRRPEFRHARCDVSAR